ncbi:MAG: pseudouridine synthase [Bacteroidales bacterium]|nr:pseudouridine synthase [Bacteroidales bacterium]
MEDYKKDVEGRRDYGQDGEKRYSAEGRVLRPRKKVGSSTPGPRTYGEHRNYGEHRSFEGGERRPYSGPRKDYNDESRSYGGPRRSYGDGENRGSYGERRSNFAGGGEHRPYGGPRKSYGEGGPRRNLGDGENRGGYGERRSHFAGSGEHRPYGGPRKSYGEGGPRRDYNDENRTYGGPRKSHGDSENRGGYKAGGRGTYPKPRKPFRKEDAFKDDSGISRMLESRPQIEKLQYSDFDSAPVMTKDEIRLNKFIANSGVCSRREADTFIQAGVVTVNGEVVTELGTKVNVNTDDVRFNGERLKGEEKVYVVMNKPKGYVTTASDPHAEKTVMDLLKGCQGRVFPVGRLDKATTGVLMFTNDGEIAERLTHPSYDKKKIYQVLLDHPLEQEDFDKILSGIQLSDGEIKADELEYIDEHDRRKLGIEIHSGKNRIVRRIFESLGYDVRALDRVYFAGLTKKGLQKGEWRYLSQGEVNILKMGAYV